MKRRIRTAKIRLAFTPLRRSPFGSMMRCVVCSDDAATFPIAIGKSVGASAPTARFESDFPATTFAV